MSEPKGKLVNQTGVSREKEFDLRDPVIFTKDDIDAEIENSCGCESPGKRFSLIHPCASKRK